jgi:hypothetical protein
MGRAADYGQRKRRSTICLAREAPEMDVLKEQRRKLAAQKGSLYRIPGGPAGYAGGRGVNTNIAI